MAYTYCDTELGTGNNDGTTMDDAWQNIEDAMNQARTAGDVLLIRRRSEDIPPDAAINFPSDGSLEAPIYHIGWPRNEEGAGSGTWANGSTEINDVSGLEMKPQQHMGRKVKQDADGKYYLITYVPWTQGTGYAFNDADPDTITDSDNLFVIRGFKAGDKIRVSGSTSNDGTYTIASVAAGTLTLDGGDSLSDEVAGDDVMIWVYDRFIIDREYAGSNTGDFTIDEDEDYDLFTYTATFTAAADDIITTSTAHPYRLGDFS